MVGRFSYLQIVALLSKSTSSLKDRIFKCYHILTSKLVFLHELPGFSELYELLPAALMVQ